MDRFSVHPDYYPKSTLRQERKFPLSVQEISRVYALQFLVTLCIEYPMHACGTRTIGRSVLQASPLQEAGEILVWCIARNGKRPTTLRCSEPGTSMSGGPGSGTSEK